MRLFVVLLAALLAACTLAQDYPSSTAEIKIQ
jgi:hypothetical protein